MLRAISTMSPMISVSTNSPETHTSLTRRLPAMSSSRTA
jgi:hypothetical protein